MSEGRNDLEKISAYIENLTFKRKIVGGIDVEEVYTSMQEINAMYRNFIEDIKKTHNEEINRLQEALDREIEKELEYSGKIDLLTSAAMDIKTNKELILQQAEAEAQLMKVQTLEEVDNIVKEREEEMDKQRRQAQIISSELSAVKENSVENINSIVDGLNELFDEINSFQEKLLELPELSRE